MPGQTSLAKQNMDPIARVENALISRRDKIALMLPKHINPDHMIRTVVRSMQKTPALKKCTPASIVGAVYELSQMGLEPDGLLGSAYILPFKGIATPVAGYKGLLRLAYQGGFVKKIYAEIVYKADVDDGHFSVVFGSEKRIDHTPDVFSDRGPAVGVYAFVELDTGGNDFVFMTRNEVESIKNRAPGAKSKESPWNHKEDYKWMWKKTVLRQICKTLPLSPKMLRAMAIEENAEAGLDFEPDLGDDDPMMGNGDIIDIDPSDFNSVANSEEKNIEETPAKAKDKSKDESKPKPKAKAAPKVVEENSEQFNF